ncbi:enoyl-CoA hydratase/isomerase family protein [Limimaricola pyoseonensis]|uniref:3-hydroxyacyl-CoA dehydrogenase n=1 Tax=Limimaricola pyoseonensis TaxID=521013 RepID=A0A1G6ZN34_9RHOB|nr:enoyl-CoA hydratase/isomerase family protein [Limimaricola pyoseonensis]SDE03793.1 3-hydroxyacyl-CoA dehydrogenase [Limimaricola pyoseonensis]
MEEQRIALRVEDGIATLRLSFAPVNALDPQLRRELGAALDDLEAREGLQGVVLCAAGPGFSVGFDLREIGAPDDAAPPLWRLCARIEALPCPVVAVLRGAALGAGAELALAAHYRLAAPDARIGLPDIVLGLVPGAGGGQRLARLCGAKAALDLLLHGRPVDAAAAQAAGLVDGVVGETPEAAEAAARELAEHLAHAGIRPRPVSARRERMIDGGTWLAEVAARRRKIAATPLRTAARIVDSVEAALLMTPVAALRFERLAHRESRADPQFAALHHVYFAERRVPRSLLERRSGRLAPTPAGDELLQRLHKAADGLGTPERRRAALVIEGLRLLSDGRLSRASDIDALAVHGLGWPRLQGGPVHESLREGLEPLLERLRLWARSDPEWTAPELLEAAARAGGDIDAALAAQRRAAAGPPAALRSG